MNPRTTTDVLFAALPPEWPEDPLPVVRRRVETSRHSVVVLDDDPTGTQTVYGVPVLTEWSVSSLREELLTTPAFYILTNSRSLPLGKVQALSRELGRNLREAAAQAGRTFFVISRGDSTLRGHFPGETDALTEGLRSTFDATLLIPCFFEGGRYTVGDVHYVEEEGVLVPVGETEFARDASFGFEASNLRRWVQEKTDGRVLAEDVASVSLETLRRGGPARVTDQLIKLAGGAVCVVNAVSRRDLAVFTLGLLGAEAQGKRFLPRTAASFVQARLGLAPRPLLTAADLSLSPSGGGLIVVGSYVPKTTRQVRELLEQTGTAGLELDVAALLDNERREAEMKRVARQADGLLADQNVVVYTSRKLITTEDKDVDGNLSIGQRVSESLIATVRLISIRPRYLLAKGGITSSDVATKGLGVKRATVLGQILPGVPVWRLGPGSRYPDLPYIVFPGNVGDVTALLEVVKALHI